MSIASQEGLRISGKIKIEAYRAGMVSLVTPYLDQIRIYRRLIAAEKTPAMREFLGRRMAESKKVVSHIKAASYIRTAVECPNLIMDSPNYGLDLLIQRLVGINTYSGNILWIEIGTGSTTPTVNDTALTTPTLRAAVNFQEDYGTTDAIVQAYITDAQLANATYTEVGSFVDGSSTIGTGQLFNHALLSPTYAKVSGQDTTIQVDINIANA